MLIEVLERTAFDFSNLENMASSTATVELARAIDTSGQTLAALVVRVHEKTIGAGASIKIQCYGVWPCQVEPAERFTENSAALEVTIDGATQEHALLRDAVTDSEYQLARPALRVVLLATQDSANKRTIQATISVGLLLFGPGRP
jgi:hypothetical protein